MTTVTTGSTTRPRRVASVAFAAAVGLLTAAGIVARFSGLEVQSYWTDEAFSVLQASLGWKNLWQVAQTEVHPPLFAVLLSGWIGLGDDGPVWTRSFTALLSSLGVLVSWLGLRRSGLDPLARGLIVAVTATSGFSITYAQEVRPYALVWLAAVGLTAASLRIAADGSRRQWAVWAGWGALASASHLFGAALVGVCAVIVLVAVRRQVVAWLTASVVALLPQAAWLAYGLTVSGFAAGAAVWIEAPGLGSVRQLLTTVFAFDDLSMLPDGFFWASPRLLIGLAVLTLVAAAGFRRQVPAASDPLWEATARLVAIALLTVAGSFVVSQFVHLWTLRNLIVVAPAATWAAVCLLAALARAEWARRVVAMATLAALAVTLVSVWTELAGKQFKTDYAGAMEYLAQVRGEAPDARFFVSTENPHAWMMSASLPRDAAYLAWLLGEDAVLLPKEEFSSVLDPVPGVSVYVWYRSTDPTRVQGREDAMLDRLGRDECVPVPMQGIAIVRCDRPR